MTEAQFRHIKAVPAPATVLCLPDIIMTYPSCYACMLSWHSMGCYDKAAMQMMGTKISAPSLHGCLIRTGVPAHRMGSYGRALCIAWIKAPQDFLWSPRMLRHWRAWERNSKRTRYVTHPLCNVSIKPSKILIY